LTGGGAPAAERQTHRDFLNRYYRATRAVYDATRKYYLFGRDEALRELAGDTSWRRLVEVGPGTGRNLRSLRRLRPDAVLGGVEASDAMLEHARPRCPGISLCQGFAEDVDYRSVLGEAPDRILFSYCLSMVQEPERALDHALDALAPGGQVWVVDFADLAGLRGPVKRGLERWLAAFHVAPVALHHLEARRGELRFGPLRYWVRARLTP